MMRLARRIQMLAVAVSIPLLILAGETVGSNVLLNIDIGAAAALRASSNDIDITTGDDSESNDTADNGGVS